MGDTDKPTFLSKGIYLRRPVKPVAPDDTKAWPPPPTVILIFGWMGGKLAHILKYSNSYRDIYPEATQIIVQSDPSFFWSTAASKHAYLQPVVDVLELLNCLPPAPKISKAVKDAKIEPLTPFPRPRVLVHSLSNGGAWQLATISEMLRSRSTTAYYGRLGASLPATALVLDSSPGNAGVQGTIRAFTAAIRSPILRVIAITLISVVYYFRAISFRLLGSTGEKNIIDVLKKKLQHPQLLPWFSTRTTSRLYLYSTKDELIPVAQVEEHAVQAREEGGFSVTMENFGDSAHVSHARVYPERYWELVRKTWQDAVSKEVGL